MAGVVNAPGRRVALVTACGGCGAQVKKKVFALCCRSCGAMLLQDSDLTERARPDALLPFAVEEETARAAFAKWIASRLLAPRELSRGDAQVYELQGVFLPLWWFSAHTLTDYAGKRGKQGVAMVGGTLTAAVNWRKTSGRVTRYFDTVLVAGCSPLAESLPMWPLNRMVPYVQGGSRGKRIIAYDVEPEFGFELAKTIMSMQIEDDVRADIGGSDQRVNGFTTWYGDPAFSLLLLPAWLVTYVYKGRTRSGLVNGATGEVAGERPRGGPL